MNIKELFEKAENGTLTYEQFEAAAKAGNAKFTDLSEGNYVSKQKYENDLAVKGKEIETLNGTIATRDTDLAGLKQKLEAAGTDATKIEELNKQLATLQTNYTEATKKYEEQLKHQAYEFAVNEFAATKKFTSPAAKRDFVRSMIAENLNFKDNKILGAEDFVKAYTEENAESFVKEDPTNPPTPQENPSPLPQFAGPTPGGQPAPIESNAFANAFHFTGVRPTPKS